MYRQTTSNEDYIPSNLIKDISMFDSHAILGPDDQERFIRMRGVASCMAVALYFPKDEIIAAEHISASYGILPSISAIKGDLVSIVSCPPLYFVEEGPFVGPRIYYDETFKKYKNPDLIKNIFSEAIPNPFVNHDTVYNGDDCIDVMIDKKTGIVRVYSPSNGDAKFPRFSEFGYDKCALNRTTYEALLQALPKRS